MRICCDCTHFDRVNDDKGWCVYPLPIWAKKKTHNANVVSDGDGTNCPAFEVNVLLKKWGDNMT